MHTDDEEFNKNDISMFCECEYIYIGDSNNLPERIQKENLISISTISKANEQLHEATISFYNTIEFKELHAQCVCIYNNPLFNSKN